MKWPGRPTPHSGQSACIYPLELRTPTYIAVRRRRFVRAPLYQQVICRCRRSRPLIAPDGSVLHNSAAQISISLRSSTNPNPLTQPFVQGNFSFMRYLDGDGEILLPGVPCPAARAAHDEKIRVAILTDIAGECYAGGLQAGFLTDHRSRRKLAVEAVCHIGNRAFGLRPLTVMFEHPVSFASADESETHRHAVVVNTAMPNGRIIGQTHANRATTTLALEWLRDWNLIDREMVNREFVLSVQNDTRVVRKSGSL